MLSGGTRRRRHRGRGVEFGEGLSPPLGVGSSSVAMSPPQKFFAISSLKRLHFKVFL